MAEILLILHVELERVALLLIDTLRREEQHKGLAAAETLEHFTAHLLGGSEQLPLLVVLRVER
jgi:hypothetical protein